MLKNIFIHVCSHVEDQIIPINGMLKNNAAHNLVEQKDQIIPINGMLKNADSNGDSDGAIK